MARLNTVRIGQMSDLHLGYRQYDKFERVKDFYEAALKATEILIEQRPDIVVVPGDVFQRERPYPVDQRHAFRLFGRFVGEGIPVFVSRGNHDASYVWSRRQGGNEIHVLEDLGLVHYLEDECKEIELEGGRSVRVWGLGHHGREAGRKLANLVEENSELLEDRSVPNILLLHEYLDNWIPNADLSEHALSVHGFDYVAIGHYHRYWVNGAGNICCSGSTEHVSAAEWDQADRSVAITTLTKSRTKWKSSIERLTYPVRPKLRRKLNLGMVTSNGATEAVLNTLQELDIDGAIVRIDVAGTLSDTQQGLDVRSIIQEAQNALHVSIVPQLEFAGLPVREDISDDEIMREVFNQSLGISKRESARWVTLAKALKGVLTESSSSEREWAGLELLYEFVEIKRPKKRRSKK